MASKPNRALEPFVDEGDGTDDTTPVALVDGLTYAFPGCCRIHIGSDQVEDYDGRIEFWDGTTETAMMVRSTSPLHERPSMRLAGLTERIAATRGAHIEVLGTSDLLLRDAAGNRHRILQADQVVYTDASGKLPGDRAVEVGADELPDVVLEVDLTTDVRRGKLRLYEKWRFPEVWVEVPERRLSSSPKRTPGLTIHRLGDGGYEEAEESEAFPTWTAAEIHAALNEERAPGEAFTPATAAALHRVGLMMRPACGYEHDPMLLIERAEGRLEGRAEGHAEGRRAGLEEGRMEGRIAGLSQGRDDGRTAARKEAVEAVFAIRGLRITVLSVTIAAASLVTMETLLRAAHACRDEDDFLNRVGAGPD